MNEKGVAGTKTSLNLSGIMHHFVKSIIKMGPKMISDGVRTSNNLKTPVVVESCCSKRMSSLLSCPG